MLAPLLYIYMNQSWTFHLICIFFWMENKLILLLHICSIEYIGLVLLLWSLESNDNAKIVQRIIFFVYLVIMKRVKCFSSSLFCCILYFFFYSFIFFEYQYNLPTISVIPRLLETPTIRLIVGKTNSWQNYRCLNK